jgi:HK97 gp10 family phage protein
MINLQITFNTPALEKLNAFSVKVKEAINDALQWSALFIKGEAKKNAPVDTGVLRSSITETGVVGDTIRVISPVEYAKYQEFGTGVYAGGGMIYPKSGRFLVWRDRRSGKMIFARAVRGVPPKRFFGKAIETFTQRIDLLKQFLSDRVKYYYG